MRCCHPQRRHPSRGRSVTSVQPLPSSLFPPHGLNSRRFFSPSLFIRCSASFRYVVFRIAIEPLPPAIPASISIPLHLRTLLGFSLGPTTHSCPPGSRSVSESLATHSSTLFHVAEIYTIVESTTRPLYRVTGLDSIRTEAFLSY